MISQSRWDDLINIVEGVLLVSNHHFNKLVKDDELKLILNVLKNNTPFQVVPDCCLKENPSKLEK